MLLLVANGEHGLGIGDDEVGRRLCSLQSGKSGAYITIATLLMTDERDADDPTTSLKAKDEFETRLKNCPEPFI